MMRLPSAALAAVLAALLLPSAVSAQARPRHRALTARALAARFEPNVGQADTRALWLGRTAGGPVSITQDGFVLATNGHAVQVRFIGTRPKAKPTGRGRLPGVANYLVGREPGRWHTGVPLYSRVRQEGLYPGVDLEHYGADSRLEHDFIVRAGADPSQIAFQVLGAEPTLLPNGDLSLEVGGSTIRLAKPVAYQTVGSRRVPVRAAYRLGAQRAGGSDRRIAFAVGQYDRRRPLVIDPVVYFSTYLGGTGDDYAYGVALDAAGAVYTTGYSTPANFPTTAGAFDTTLDGPNDAFVTKLAPDGQTLVYSTFVGGTSYDSATDIAVDGSGCAYIIGGTTSTDLPVTPGAFQTSFPTSYTSAFVAKLNPAGNGLVYCTYFGDTSHTYPGGICVDADGHAFICGTGTGAPLSEGSLRPGPGQGGGYEAFVAELSTSGSALVYGALLGGPENDAGHRIAVRNGIAYVACTTGSQTFPITPGAFNTTFPGGTTLAVAAVAPGGASLTYSTFVDNCAGDLLDIAVDDMGCAHVVGQAVTSTFPTTPGAYRTTYVGYEPFVLKLNALGSGLVYSTFLGAGSGSATTVCLWGDRACVAGVTWNNGMPVTPDAVQPAHVGGDAEGFAVVLNSAGSAADFATFVGGGGDDRVAGIAANGSGRLCLTGWTSSSDFWSFRAIQPAPAGNLDAYVACIDLNGSKLATSLYTLSRTAVITETVTFKAYLSEVGSGVKPRNRLVGFSVDGTEVGRSRTDAAGKAQLDWVVGPGPASRPILAEFAGDYAYLPSTATATLTAETWTTKMAGFDRTQRITGKTELKARLLRSDNAPLYNRTVDFSVDGTFVISRPTSTTGYASYPYYTVPEGAGAGERTILSSFTGNAGYGSCSQTAKLTVLKATPYIWVLPRSVPVGGVARMYAYFRRLIDYQKQEGKPVTWRVDGTWVADVLTGTGADAGMARYSYTTVEPAGVHTMRCEFAGDAWVDAGYGEGTLTIY